MLSKPGGTTSYKEKRIMGEIWTERERDLRALRPGAISAAKKGDHSQLRSLGFLMWEAKKELKKIAQRRKLEEESHYYCSKCSSRVLYERGQLYELLGKPIECQKCASVPRLAVIVPVLSGGGYSAGREVKYGVRLI